MKDYSSFHWTHSFLKESDFTFRIGVSVRQLNGYDCGVFALLNAECSLKRPNVNNRIFDQRCIPYIRTIFIKNLIHFPIACGEDFSLFDN